jgi:hypothetical protein
MPWLLGRSIRSEARTSVRTHISIGGPARSSLSVVLCFALVLLSVAGTAQESSELPSSTEDHVAGKGWWPTKASTLGQAYAGESACGRCHAQEFSSQADTSMAKAAFRLSDNPQNAEPPSGRFESGPFTYRFVEATDGLSLEVESRGQSISSKVLWAFGAGVHGSSYILQGPGQLYEAQVSSFSSTHSLDVTPGHTKPLEGSLQKALGNRLSIREETRCFACHTTASSTGGGLDLEKAVPGVHCEACHGPGTDHIRAAESHLTDRTTKTIFNPAHLTPAGSVDFCGSCHRTLMDVVLDPGLKGLSSIRFQPYRLQKSRCWEQTQGAGLTCTECHNPHEPLVRDASFYDRKCLSCHNSKRDGTQGSAAHPAAGGPPACPKATANCVGCHMPKYNLPEMHSQFTDHFIRIVRPGELYPN